MTSDHEPEPEPIVVPVVVTEPPYDWAEDEAAPAVRATVGAPILPHLRLHQRHPLLVGLPALVAGIFVCLFLLFLLYIAPILQG